MSKLGRKARPKEKVEESNARKVLLYLIIALAVLAIIFGVVFS